MSINSQFQEQGSFEIDYRGKKINRFFNLYKKGKYKLKFTFVKTNSPFLQLIVIFLDEFKGKVFLNGEIIKIPIHKDFSRQWSSCNVSFYATYSTDNSFSYYKLF